MEIELPDGTVLDAPDNADPSAVAKAYLAKQAPQKPSILEQGLNFAKGTLGMAMTPLGAAVAEPVVSAVTSMGAMPVAGIAGAAAAPFVGRERAAGIVNRTQDALTYQPGTALGQMVGNTASAPYRLLGEGADKAGGAVTDATGSPFLGAATNTAIQSLPMLLARGRVGRGISSLDRPGPVLAEGAPEAAPKAPVQGRQAGLAGVPEKPPTIDELRSQASESYKRASDAGIVVKPEAVTKLKSEISTDLNKEGLDPDLHPAATAALNRVIKSDGPLTLDQVETLRKIANDAKGTKNNSADARLGGKIVDHIDNFFEGLSQNDVTSGDPAAAGALQEARGLYTRLKKAEEISTLIDRAGISAQGFSGSGFENALRVEFRALAKNQNKMRRFSPEEREAIRKVAMGGTWENTLRYIGKLAPTGGLSTMLNLGLVAGTGGAGLAIPIVGTAGRMAATRMTMNNAAKAEALMRAGPKPPTNALTAKKPTNALIQP